MATPWLGTRNEPIMLNICSSRVQQDVPALLPNTHSEPCSLNASPVLQTINLKRLIFVGRRVRLASSLLGVTLAQRCLGPTGEGSTFTVSALPAASFLHQLSS